MTWLSSPLPARERLQGGQPPRLGRRRFGLRAAVGGAVVIGAALSFMIVDRSWPNPWTGAEQAALQGLALGALSKPPLDPSNRFADDPAAARLGARLFRDQRLSGNGRVSCRSCHDPARAFTDGRALSRGVGVGVRNTPSIVAGAYAPALFWDGRRDSQWAQAITPIEAANEMGGNRKDVARLIASRYRIDYEATFGALPATVLSAVAAPQRVAEGNDLPPPQQDQINRVFANVGKALAAYQRALRFAPSRFDRYVSLLQGGHHWLATWYLSAEERLGLSLFVGKAHCALCHRGPLLTGHEFFSLGLPLGEPGPDWGRADAFHQQREDPFNCLGPYSDALPEQCSEVRFLSDDRLSFLANFKTPSLRNVSLTAPYMHAGQLRTLADVVDHYARAPRVAFPEHTDILPLVLDARERAALVAFLGTLESAIDDPYAAARLAD